MTDWNSDRALVLDKLNDLNDRMGALVLSSEGLKSSITNEITKIKVELAVLKVKMAFIAAGVSAATSVITALVILALKGLGK